MIYRNKHSVSPVKTFPVSKLQWENSERHFFISPKEQIVIPKNQNAALENKNMFDVLMEAVKYCSLGQITDALFEVGGQYRRNM